MSDAVLVREPGAVDPGLYHQVFGVHQDVALAAPDLLAAVVTPLLTLDAWSIDPLQVFDNAYRLTHSVKRIK